VRIASSIQAWQCEPLFSKRCSDDARTLEAMRTQCFSKDAAMTKQPNLDKHHWDTLRYGTHAVRALALCFALVLAGAASVASCHPNQLAGQNPPTQSSTNQETKSREAALPPYGEITGRVISDDGQPVSNARISASALGGTNQPARSTSTDAEGNFRFADLPRGVYSLFATSPGYVSTSTFVPASERPIYRIGDTATITMVKGGVITGAVTDAGGIAIPSLTIRAIRVRDAEGKLVAPSATARDRNTDDRGIYRIYGLVPGSYVVMATSPNRSGQPSEHDGKAPTFHPSSTRDTASEVTVRSGEEAGNIAIRFRAEPGYVISGTFAGNLSAADAATMASVELSYAGSGMPINTVSARMAEGQRGFAIYGVADGEYEVRAQRYGENDLETLVALPRRVSVKGADVTGVALRLTPLGSISGRVVLESTTARVVVPACAGERAVLPQETILTVRRTDQASGENELLQRWVSATTAPNDQSQFVLRNLMAARYRVETRLPNENWYVRSITAPSPTSARQLVDAGRGGFALKSGEKAKGLTVTIAAGAAAVRGKITPAVEGTKLPPHLRVHLIPAEPERADDVLRYAQVTAQNDGGFALTNLAPGKYRLLARAITNDEEATPPLRPIAWDDKERVNLRREAETANIEIELQPCQRVKDYTLRYVHPAANSSK
jgi:hypothetical protein